VLRSRTAKLGAALAGASLLLLSARRLSRRPRVDSYSIAERINVRIAAARAEEQRADRKRQQRRLALTTAFIVLVAVLGWLFLTRRPPIEATLRTTLPSPHSTVAFTGFSRRVQPWVRAQLHTLVLHSDSVQPSGDQPAEAIELILPVRSQACRLLVKRVGGRCDGMREAPKRIQPPVIMTWPSGATATITTRSARRFALTPPAGEAPRQPLSIWALGMRASRSRLVVDCVEGSALLISRTGAAPVPAQCVETHPTRWHVSFALPIGEPREKALELIDLSSLHAHVSASQVRLRVNDALVRLGDSLRGLEGHRISVAIGASNENPVAMDLAATRVPNRSSLALGTDTASVFRIAGSNAIPTTFHRNREIWLPVIFAAIGVLATAWLDRSIL